MKSATFRTILGTKPILLSAPHVYPHKRPKLSMAYKIGEPLTDTIVEEICKELKTFGILLTDESEYDYNYHKIETNIPVKNFLTETSTSLRPSPLPRPPSLLPPSLRPPSLCPPSLRPPSLRHSFIRMIDERLEVKGDNVFVVF